MCILLLRHSAQGSSKISEVWRAEFYVKLNKHTPSFLENKNWQGSGKDIKAIFLQIYTKINFRVNFCAFIASGVFIYFVGGGKLKQNIIQCLSNCLEKYNKSNIYGKVYRVLSFIQKIHTTLGSFCDVKTVSFFSKFFIHMSQDFLGA